MALDISAAGSKIAINTKGGIKTVITEFSDEGVPFEANDIEVTGNAVTLNGQLVLWRKPVAYVVTLTVLPNSQDDRDLQAMLDKAHIRHGQDVASAQSLETTLTITTPQINGAGVQGNSIRTEYSKGRILGGPTGPSTNAEGKLSGRTYTFIFEQCNHGGSTGGVDIGA